MGGIMSKWLVLHEYAVTGGAVGDEAVARWVAAARGERLGHTGSITRYSAGGAAPRTVAGCLSWSSGSTTTRGGSPPARRTGSGWPSCTRRDGW